MELDETFSRVQRLHEPCGSCVDGVARRNQTTGSRVQKKGRCEPTKTRTEAKSGQAAFRFPRPCLLEGYLLSFRFFLLLPDQLLVREALTYDLADKVAESVAVA